MTKVAGATSVFDPAFLRDAAWSAVKKLNPLTLVRNPIMFVVEILSIAATLLVAIQILEGRPNAGAQVPVTIWLWITVLFGNFAEAMAEGRGKARANMLRATRQETSARRLPSPSSTEWESVGSRDLRSGDIVFVQAGGIIPADGEIIEGIASVDESPITGVAASVIREAGGDRSGATGGTKIVSDWLKIRVVASPGGSFLDRMIAMIDGGRQEKTPSETALTMLLIGQTLVFLIVAASLAPFMAYSGAAVPAIYLLALAVTLMPTTIGALLSAIGIAGMDRLVRANVIAKSGRAVEACGDVDTLLIDKTGTITFGKRMAHAFKPLPGTQMRELAEAAYLASLSDATPEGKSIVELARRTLGELVAAPEVIRFIPFSSEMRLSGADLHSLGEIRKGAEDAIRAYAMPGDNYQLTRIVQDIARTGGTPIVVAKNRSILGVIHLTDVIKPAIRGRFQELRKMGVRTVMITGDNALTAASIAAEAGVDDVLAEATPEMKLALIRKLQAEGRLVAMCGDGSNDAPALAQADVGMAMNDGAHAAKDAANLVDLDSDPTKLVEVVRIGKELLISRGALTTFSLANDVAKYFTVLPPLFATVYPGLAALNIMRLHSPQSAILSAVIFNALIIAALMPLALRGVKYRPASAEAMLGRNLLIYGLGGIVAPLLGIKAMDMLIAGLGMV